MNLLEKRDLSVSMTRANVIVFFLTVPVVIMQLLVFRLLHNASSLLITWNFLVFIGVVIAGILVHELIHGLGWMVFGKKPLAAIKLGIQWKTLTPYAHGKEPVEVNAYRNLVFLPGLVLGILPYLISLALGDQNLLWFGIVHTMSAGGDWLILWLLRRVKPGMLVEDHPTRAGCYVIEKPI